MLAYFRNLFRTYRMKRERGQSIVEFALLAPLLLILFMGIFDFGWLLHQQIQMDNATRLGARRGAVGDSNDEILKRMVESMSFTLPDDAITIEVRDSDGVAISDSTDRTPDNRMFIAIDRPDVKLVTPLAGLVHSISTINLHSEAEFLIE